MLETGSDLTLVVFGLRYRRSYKTAKSRACMASLAGSLLTIYIIISHASLLASETCLFLDRDSAN